MKFPTRYIAPAVLLIISIILFILLWLSTGISGETDSITHFQMSKYAFQHPEYFLNHWGKPLFTILSSPFSQFGYFGAVSFNLVCGLLSAWFTYLIAKTLEYRHAWIAIVFTIFTPVYLFIMFTSLTEILFSLVLVAAIYLFVRKSFVWSAIVISFLPFARVEGMMFIIIFIPALFWLKQYRSLPFLLTGLIIFSIAGWPVYHDFLWFFTKMPYSSSGSELYGSGSFWYYFSKLREIIDYPLLLLGGIGLLIILMNFRIGIKNLHEIKYTTLYFLIFPSLFGFILAQSFLWWQGLMGVLASTRFMACILPLYALFALAGFEWVMEKLRSSGLLSMFVSICILLLVGYKPFTHRVLPMKSAQNFAVMEKLTNWLKTTPYNNRMAFYSDPMFPFYMDIDPYDTQKCFQVYNYENMDPASLLKPGHLLIWDAQFSGFEGRLPFDSLLKNNNLKLLNIFTPNESFTIIGGEKYKLAVFIKSQRDTSKMVYKQFFLNDFEGSLPENHAKHISTDKSFSGKRSILMTSDYIYCPGAEGNLKSLPGSSNISLKASVKVLNPSAEEKGQILLVISIEDQDHKTYKYVVARDTDTKYEPGNWFNLVFSDVLERDKPINGIYKVYVWYTGKNKIYVDDLKLEWIPVGYE